MRLLRCPKCGSTKVMMVESSIREIHNYAHIAVENTLLVSLDEKSVSGRYYTKSCIVKCGSCEHLLADDLGKLLETIAHGEIELVDAPGESVNTMSKEERTEP